VSPGLSRPRASEPSPACLVRGAEKAPVWRALTNRVQPNDLFSLSISARANAVALWIACSRVRALLLNGRETWFSQ
jgi:hypothetical protein